MTILYSLFIVIPVTQEKISGKFLSIFKQRRTQKSSHLYMTFEILCQVWNTKQLFYFKQTYSFLLKNRNIRCKWKMSGVTNSAGIQMFKVNKRNTRTRYEIKSEYQHQTSNNVWQKIELCPGKGAFKLFEMKLT